MTLAEPARPSANDRFKSGDSSRIAGALVVATVLHALVFQLWPEMSAEVLADAGAEIITIDLPPDVTIPEAPAPFTRPPRPVISDEAPVDAVLPVVEWREVPELPPPPRDRGGGEERRLERFVPYTVAPSLANSEEMLRVLEREYPPALRDAGIGGTVGLLLHVDENGRVTDAEVGRSSGLEGLDRAALRVADVMRFRPAMNRDKRVAVWIRLPVTFQRR